ATQAIWNAATQKTGRTRPRNRTGMNAPTASSRKATRCFGSSEARAAEWPGSRLKIEGPVMPVLLPCGTGAMSDWPLLLRLDRHGRQPAVGELGLRRGQLGGGAVGTHAHAVDGLAVDGGRFYAGVQSEQRDARLDGLGVAGGAEGAGLEDVARLAVLAGDRGGRRRRGGRRCRSGDRGFRDRCRQGGGVGSRRRGGLALLFELLAARLLGARAGGEFRVGHRHFLAG